uniref:RING-H2 finger protein ATL5 n=1 Tax=Anthurium amnicola TaxID=1678845 RepID=A0A1D1ZEJ7_9ARAE
MMGDPGCVGEAMDVEKRQAFGDEGHGAGPSSVPCSICLELVAADPRERSVAKLQCGHEFHLDCIGSAFNAKGMMQCPNCRKVEKGRWLYANGCRSFSEFNVDDFGNEDLYDFNYSEMPFGLHWCPFRGFTQLASLFEEGEIQAGAYHDLSRSASLGDSGASGSSTHVCPYLALHGFHHAVHMHPAPSNPADTLADTGLFHRHVTGITGRSSVDMMNPQNFTAEPQHHNWQQPPSATFPVLGASDQSASHNMASRFPRDSSGQQRSIMRNGSNAVTSLGSPLVGDSRVGHNRAHGGHMFQQSASSSSIRSGAFLPVRRTRPRRVALISSIATTSSAEIGGFYGFSLSGSASGRHQDAESSGRHFDRVYGWGREGFVPLPWVPVEGDPQWWSPFHPSYQNPQPGSGDSAGRRYPQRGDTEGMVQGLPESGYQQIPFLRMPPFM